MSKVYAVSMSTHVGFWIKADSEEEAQEWLNMHTIEDVRHLTDNYEMDWDEYVDDTCVCDVDEFSPDDYIDATDIE